MENIEKKIKKTFNLSLVSSIIFVIVGLFLWHSICSKQTEEEKRESNPGIILVLPCLILLWPIGLASYIREKISK